MVTASASRSRFALLGIAFTFVVAGALALAAWAAYKEVQSGFEEQLERRLKSYAASAAAGLSPRALDRIESADDATAVLYRNRLKALQGESGVRRVAVVTREGNLVLATDDAPFGEPEYGQDLNELEACFARGPVATVAYEDAEGRLHRNGFAPVPVRDDEGNPTGEEGFYAVVVEVEADYLDRLAAVRLALAPAVLGVFLVTLAAALVIGRSQGRLRKDLAAQRRLAELAQFSAGMAHQIKNPLAAFRGYLELLSRGLTEPMQKQITGKLLAEIGILDRVVRDFLAFSRGAMGQPEPTTLRAALQPVVDAAEQRAAAGVAVETDIESGEQELEVDVTALRQALINLSVNAVEALAETGGIVRITARSEGRMIRVEVSDNGPGIPEEIQERLFEPFQTGKPDGTGLGLAISRRLLRDLGGELILERTGETGTVFAGTFPKRPTRGNTGVRRRT